MNLQRRAKARTVPRARGSGRSLFIVDCDPDTRATVRQAASWCGWATLESGEPGDLKAACDGPYPPDLVLFDATVALERGVAEALVGLGVRMACPEFILMTDERPALAELAHNRLEPLGLSRQANLVKPFTAHDLAPRLSGFRARMVG